MGNESSKSKTGSVLRPFSLKSGPSSSVVQQHLENAQKSRILQLKGSGLKAVPPVIKNVFIFFTIKIIYFTCFLFLINLILNFKY